MAEHDVEQVWREFWIPIIDGAVGEYDPAIFGHDHLLISSSAYEQIKRELYDYRMLAKDLPAFFDDITGGRASKANTSLEVIRDLVREHLLQEVEWRVQEELDAWQRGYDKGHEDGRDRGFEDGLDEARNRI